MTLVAGKRVLLKIPSGKEGPEHLHNKTVTLSAPNGYGDGWYIKEASGWFWNHWFHPIPEVVCRCKKPKFIEYELLGEKVVICSECGEPKPKKKKKNV